MLAALLVLVAVGSHAAPTKCRQMKNELIDKSTACKDYNANNLKAVNEAKAAGASKITE